MRKLIVVLATVALSSLSLADTPREKAEDRLERAAEVVQQIMSAPDKGIPEEVIRNAKCIAVVPHEIRAGFIFGARGGRGVATCRTKKGWSAPAFFTIAGGSFGLQVGLEGVDNVLMIMNQRGMDRLLSDKFQIGGEASAAAGPVGRHAAAGIDWKLETEILSYSRARGIFAGVSLDGTYVRPDNEAIRTVYGKNLSTRTILAGEVGSPGVAHVFLAAVQDADQKAVQDADQKAEKKS